MMLRSPITARTPVVAAARPSRLRVVRTQAVFDTEKERAEKEQNKPKSTIKTRGLNMTGREYALTLPGISQPFPNMFDPAGLSTSATPDDIKRWRESELTHGRVAMLASLGFIVQEQTKDMPFFLNDWGRVNGPAIIHAQQIETQRPLFWEILVLAIGLCETYRVSVGWATPVGEDFNQLRDDYEPGNLGFDPLGLKPTNAVAYKDMQTRELNNGRLAMIAIIAFWLQELNDPKHTIIEQLKRTVTGQEYADVVNKVSEGIQNLP